MSPRQAEVWDLKQPALYEVMAEWEVTRLEQFTGISLRGPQRASRPIKEVSWAVACR